MRVNGPFPHGIGERGRVLILALAVFACAPGCRKPPAEYDRPKDSAILELDHLEALLARLPGDKDDRLDMGGYDVKPVSGQPGLFSLERNVTVMLRGHPRAEIVKAADRYRRWLEQQLRDHNCEVRGPRASQEDESLIWEYDYTLADRTGKVTVRVEPVPGKAEGFDKLVSVDVVELAPGTPRKKK